MPEGTTLWSPRIRKHKRPYKKHPLALHRARRAYAEWQRSCQVHAEIQRERTHFRNPGTEHQYQYGIDYAVNEGGWRRRSKP